MNASADGRVASGLQADWELRMRSDPTLLVAVRAAVEAAVEQAGFAPEESHRVALAVHEAIVNVIRHGYAGATDRPVCLRFTRTDEAGCGGVAMVLEDEAESVDPADIVAKNPADVRPGGLGVHIIRTVMDRVEYEPREGGGMRLLMWKRAAVPEKKETA